jgi:hypothetical protein
MQEHTMYAIALYVVTKTASLRAVIRLKHDVTHVNAYPISVLAEVLNEEMN